MMTIKSYDGPGLIPVGSLLEYDGHGHLEWADRPPLSVSVSSDADQEWLNDMRRKGVSKYILCAAATEPPYTVDIVTANPQS